MCDRVSRPVEKALKAGVDKLPNKESTMSQYVGDNLDNCRKGPKFSSGFHLNAITHFNTTFKGPIEMEDNFKFKFA